MPGAPAFAVSNASEVPGGASVPEGYTSAMNDTLTYLAAVRLLPDGKSRLLLMLNSAEAAGSVVWAESAMAEESRAPMSLLELGHEIVEFGRETLQKTPEWHAGVSRFTRSQRLAAAHVVLVVSSYFEAIAESGLSTEPRRPAVPDGGQAMTEAEGKAADGYADITEFLRNELLPVPEPHRPYADVRTRVAACYEKLGDRLARLTRAPGASDVLGAAAKNSLRNSVRELAARALARYDNGYRSLAADNAEYRLWASGTGTAREPGVGLSAMATLLAETAIRRPGQRTRAPLALSYRAALGDAIIGSGQAPDGVVLPALGEAYVDPACKVAEVGPGDRPSEADWWESRELVPDISAFLAGYLTSLRAVRGPLAVLGEPGSGKSKLVEVIAARLPEQDFLPVLVQLRDVAAESMVQEQIEQAILHGPGRHASWHDLLETAEGALPVVLLDGLDEQIQATAVNRYDYLEQVRDFQLRQAAIGRPVAVIVTSRTVVADLVRFPSGSLALQLQPFTSGQVRRWLEVWNRHNASVLAARGLRPLPAETALAHQELTEQPLLLLLVALFDAADNHLQRLDAHLGRAELYERLITEFAGREVAKTARNRALPAHRQQRLATGEVQRLAVVALAMFVRGRQAASEAELNRDLPALLAENDRSVSDDPDASLTSAQRATGRFFFIHKSEARLHDDRVRSYEFLHATFGEFLVARFAVSALCDVSAHRELGLRGAVTAGTLDDGSLYAALSFSCLASRTPIIGFLGELLHQLPDGERALCRETLVELIAESLYPRPSRSFQHYEPVHDTVTRRLACYSANLVLMLVLLAGNINASEFLGPVDTGKKWASFGYLWRSSFTTSEWRGLTDTIRAQASRSTGLVDILLRLEDGSPVSPTDSMILTDLPHDLTKFDLRVSPRNDMSYGVEVPSSGIAGLVFRYSAFTPDWHVGMMLLHVVPHIRVAGGQIRYQLGDGTEALPGYMLAHLDNSLGSDTKTRLGLYEAYAGAMTASPELREQLLRRLQRDMPDFTTASVIGLMREVRISQLTRTATGIINKLWESAGSDSDRQAVAQFVSDEGTSWSAEGTTALSEDLRDLAARLRGA
jgi:hypothetical protein